MEHREISVQEAVGYAGQIASLAIDFLDTVSARGGMARQKQYIEVSLPPEDAPLPQPDSVGPTLDERVRGLEGGLRNIYGTIPVEFRAQSDVAHIIERVSRYVMHHRQNQG